MGDGTAAAGPKPPSPHAALQRLEWNSAVPKDTVKVNVEKGWVTLTVQVDWHYQQEAASLGLKHAFINQPVEVARLRPELAALIGLPGRRPDIVMRFGYGPELPYSPRRPVDAVIMQ